MVSVLEPAVVQAVVSVLEPAVAQAAVSVLEPAEVQAAVPELVQAVLLVLELPLVLEALPAVAGSAFLIPVSAVA